MMTDRSEIERLLNKTGRTLEGLPDEYPIETVDRIACMTDWEYSNRILHQSDVIELLVGALRDALDKQMQKPLTLEELGNMPNGSVVWEEVRLGRKSTFSMSSAYVIALMSSDADDEYEELFRYGHKRRAWKTLPTDEEREAAAWES
jgi:hypothetical protein